MSAIHTIIKTIDVERTAPQKTEDGLAVSKAVYWEHYYDHPDFNYEWNNGYLEEKPVSDYLQVRTYSWFFELFQHYLRVRPIARYTMLEMGFEMNLPHKSSIRKPDLGVVLSSNPIPLKDRDRRYFGIFDLCIESLSDSNRAAVERDTVVKYGEYGTAGIQEYYILDDRQRETAFLENVGGLYRPMSQVNGVIQSKVLPGFQLRVDDLYRQPSFIDLAMDPIYQGFVLPEYQAERAAREREAQRAEWERVAKERETQRAEREAQRAERLAAKLRALGIDPDAE